MIPNPPISSPPISGRTKFETEMPVRLDDIDMNQHVHHTRDSGKLCCDGYLDYTMVRLATGRAEPIPGWIRDRYTI